MTWYPNSFIPYPFSGIRSGFVIHPYHVSFLYDELSGVEELIGLNPLNGFSSLTARISGIESGSLTPGNLSVLSPLFLVTNGGNSILSGQIAGPLQAGFLNAVDWTSFNSRVFRAGDTITGGLTVLGNLSGLRVFGSVVSGTIISGTNYTIGTNGSILPQLSGNVNIGSPTLYLSGVYTNTINSKIVVAQRYNEIPNGLINGFNKTFIYSFPPYDNSLRSYLNGIRVIQSGLGSPVIDFSLSGLTQTFYSAPLSGSVIISDYSYLV